MCLNTQRLISSSASTIRAVELTTSSERIHFFVINSPLICPHSRMSFFLLITLIFCVYFYDSASTLQDNGRSRIKLLCHSNAFFFRLFIAILHETHKLLLASHFGTHPAKGELNFPSRHFQIILFIKTFPNQHLLQTCRSNDLGSI